MYNRSKNTQTVAAALFSLTYRRKGQSFFRSFRRVSEKGVGAYALLHSTELLPVVTFELLFQFTMVIIAIIALFYKGDK